MFWQFQQSCETRVLFTTNFITMILLLSRYRPSIEVRKHITHANGVAFNIWTLRIVGQKEHRKKFSTLKNTDIKMTK